MKKKILHSWANVFVWWVCVYLVIEIGNQGTPILKPCLQAVSYIYYHNMKTKEGYYCSYKTCIFKPTLNIALKAVATWCFVFQCMILFCLMWK